MGIRTPGLVIANDALYQLSYTPAFAGVMLTEPRHYSRMVELRLGRPVIRMPNSKLAIRKNSITEMGK